MVHAETQPPTNGVPRAAKKVERHVIDAKALVVVTKTQPLFTDDEIEAELYAPLVRELVIPDTIINDRFSATKKMIDGANEYYIKECKEKGKHLNTGAVSFAKGTIELAVAADPFRQMVVVESVGPAGGPAARHAACHCRRRQAPRRDSTPHVG